MSIREPQFQLGVLFQVTLQVKICCQTPVQHLTTHLIQFLARRVTHEILNNVLTWHLPWVPPFRSPFQMTKTFIYECVALWAENLCLLPSPFKQATSHPCPNQCVSFKLKKINKKNFPTQGTNSIAQHKRTKDVLRGSTAMAGSRSAWVTGVQLPANSSFKEELLPGLTVPRL